MTDWIALSYSLTIICLVAIAIYAIIYTKFFTQKNENVKHVLETSEGFITARKTQGMWRIAWSFYAGSVGSWVITSTASYASYAGYLGVIFYAVATGIPIIMQAYFGDIVQTKFPNANSLGDFILLRFGPTAKLATIIVTLINMSIFMLAEFTTVGGLFSDFVGSVSYPIIIIVAVLTTIYTVYGGLLVSIVTDQVQGIISVLLTIILTIYVAATFRRDLPANFGPYEPMLGPNLSGYSSIFTMPISLAAATVFNEGMWQRVWAAEDHTALKRGGIIACFAIVFVVFIFGFGGLLAVWGGLVDYENTNPNLYIFQLFKSDPSAPNAHVENFIEVLVLVLAAVMNESAIDSLQNGLAATISSHFLRGKPLLWARICVLLINIIIVPFALANYSVLSIFLLGNMLGVCWFPPVIMGGIWDSELGKRVVCESSMLFGGVIAVIASTVYGIAAGPSQCIQMWNDGALYPPAPDICSCASDAALYNLTNPGVNCATAGAYWTWLGQPYMWQYFLIALGVSTAGTLAFGLLHELFYRLNIHFMGVTELLLKVPGYAELAGLTVDHAELQRKQDDDAAKPQFNGDDQGMQQVNGSQDSQMFMAVSPSIPVVHPYPAVVPMQPQLFAQPVVMVPAAEGGNVALPGSLQQGQQGLA